LERFEDNDEQLIYIHHLLKDHTYSVWKLYREQLVEVHSHSKAM